MGFNSGFKGLSRKFITVLTYRCHWYISWAGWIHSHPTWYIC